MRFSIIIPFFNEEEKIENLLSSLKNMQYSNENYEIIFIDNNSNDGTSELIKNQGFYVEKATKIASSYYARNIGVSCAGGKYLLFIDADCIVDKNILSEYGKYIDVEESENCIFAGDILPFSIAGSNFERYAATRKILNQKSAATGWSYKPFAQTANALFLKEHVIGVSGFNAQMTSGGDAEICWRITDKYQAKVIYAKDAFVHHQHRKDAKNFSSQFKKYGQGRVQQILHSKEFANNKKTEDVSTLIQLCINLCEEIEKFTPNNHDLVAKSIDVLKEASYLSGYISELNNFFGSDFPNGSYSTLHSVLNNIKK